MPVCISGHLLVQFHGDRATGCAAHELCAYAGTESLHGDAGAELTLLAYSFRRRRGYDAALALDGAEVSRIVRSGPVPSCRDSSSGLSGFFSPNASHGTLTVRLAGAGSHLLGTRCAGPLDADVAGALPVGRLSLRAGLRGDTAIQLTGTRPFASHGFAGLVSSNLVLRLGRAKTTKPPSTSPARGPATRRRFVTIRYRLTRVAGLLSARVRGAGSATACHALDACGSSGTIRVAPRAPRSGEIDLVANGPARRPYRDFLAALGLGGRGNPHGIEVSGGGAWNDGGAITERLRQDGACRDSARLLRSGLTLAVHAGRIKVQYSPIEAQGSDPLRTRCPGPALGSHMLASTVLPLSVLDRRRFTLSLGRGISFDDHPYRIRTDSTLSFALKRMNVLQEGLPDRHPGASRSGDHEQEPDRRPVPGLLGMLGTIGAGHLPS